MIKIIEKLPKLTLERVLQGNQFPEAKGTKEKSLMVGYENEIFFNFLTVGGAIEEFYLSPPTVPQIIDLIVENLDKMTPELYRRLTTVTSTVENWDIDNGLYVVSHGVSPLEYGVKVDRFYGSLVGVNLNEIKGRVIELNTRNIEEAVGFMPKTPEEKVTYIIPVGENINDYKEVIDLARIGYTAVLEGMLKLASEKTGREITVEEYLSAEYQNNVKNPLRFETGHVHFFRGKTPHFYFIHLEPTPEELRWSFFPMRYSLLLPKNLKHVDMIEDRLSPEVYLPSEE